MAELCTCGHTRGLHRSMDVRDGYCNVVKCACRVYVRLLGGVAKPVAAATPKATMLDLCEHCLNERSGLAQERSALSQERDALQAKRDKYKAWRNTLETRREELEQLQQDLDDREARLQNWAEQMTAPTATEQQLAEECRCGHAARYHMDGYGTGDCLRMPCNCAGFVSIATAVMVDENGFTHKNKNGVPIVEPVACRCAHGKVDHHDGKGVCRTVLRKGFNVELGREVVIRCLCSEYRAVVEGVPGDPSGRFTLLEID